MLTIKKIYDDISGEIVAIRYQKNSIQKARRIRRTALEDYLNTSKIGLTEYKEVKRYQDVMRSIKPKYDNKTKQTLLK